MIVYLDSDYCCHLTNDGTMRSVETIMFDEKCRTFIEGYRYIPEGETWISPQGIEFHGAMASPFIDYNILAKAQDQYEEDLAQMQDMQNALEILGVTNE